MIKDQRVSWWGYLVPTGCIYGVVGRVVLRRSLNKPLTVDLLIDLIVAEGY